MRDIQKEIQENLDAIEERYKVKILLAVESGSRAWGFASPDSDYDVRFIYMHRPEEYLRIDAMKDVIEWQLDEVLDINGWDLRKALLAFGKGNPNVMEWANSPIVCAVPLLRDCQQHAARLSERRYGPLQEVFLCAAAASVLPVDREVSFCSADGV